MDRIRGPRQTLRAQRGPRETSEFSTQSDHEKLRRKTRRLNHADGQQREQLESPRVPSQGTAIKLTLSFCIYHLWCKYIQMTDKTFMKYGRLYRRLFSQESRISQFMQLNLANKTPRSYDALCQGSQDIMPDDLRWS